MAKWHWIGQLEIGLNGQLLTTGTGDPEGAITAPIGSIYQRVDGGAGSSVYFKETGAGNTGWSAAAAGTTGPAGAPGPQAFGNYVTKTTSYDIQSSDNNTVFAFSGIGITAKLPASAPAVPWMVVIFNASGFTMGLDFNGLHPDYPATLSLFQNQSAIIWSSGTTYTAIINPSWFTTGGSIINATGHGELDLYSAADGGGFTLFDGNSNLIDTSSGTEMRFQTTTLFRFFGSATTFKVDGDLQADGDVTIAGSTYAPVAVNTQTASYQAVLTDADQLVAMNVVGSNNFTIPAFATIAFPVGTTLSVLQQGAGQVTLLAAGGVLLHNPSSNTTRAQWSIVSVVQISQDVWVASGDLT